MPARATECRHCGIGLTEENRDKCHAACKPCRNERARERKLQARLNSGRHCSECPTPIDSRNKSGLCESHNMKAIRSRLKGQSGQEVVEEHLCHRCGIKTTRPICGDCKSVVSDLKELHLWVEVAA